jgi:hypothetical protein
VEERHKNLLESLTIELLSAGYLDTPFQLAISSYDLINKKGEYSLFTTDVFPILNYMHPLLSSSLPDEWRDDLDFLKRIHVNYKSLNATYLADLELINNKNFIQKRYELLRSISISKPVIEELFLFCCEESISQKGKPLALNPFAYISETKEGELLCKLETALFFVSDYSYYLCTFFNYKGSTAHKVFCISLFCQRTNNNKIGNKIIDYLKNNDEVNLLENIIEEYQTLFDSSIDDNNPWFSRIEIFEKFLKNDKKINARENNKVRAKAINHLEEVINKMQAFCLLENNALQDKLALVDEFAKRNSVYIDLNTRVNMLNELNRSL